ncbi:uncharacterized protein LOC106061270 [Biomphalaria glabrata]|uniref:Uncharacterized protein LOC106061270 n=1 Tax=Biomphalaria glabrata TaxID=6526 RepID=A0A9W3A4W5_BIOGL|nr:uncharacterized protein LOC106061270 [Biomphalaria glabrata]
MCKKKIQQVSDDMSNDERQLQSDTREDVIMVQNEWVMSLENHKTKRMTAVMTSNTVYDRFKFFTRNQKDGETFEQYYTDLKNSAKECKFDNLRDELTRDRLVCGKQLDRVRDSLLRDVDLTLEKAASISRTDEHTQNQMIEMKGLHVDAAYKLEKTEDSKPVKTSQENIAKNHVTSIIKDCRYCNKVKCKKIIHFAAKCRSKHFKAVDSMENESQVSQVNELCFQAVGTDNNVNVWMVDVNVMPKIVKMKIDTGAQAYVIVNVKHLRN